MHSRLCTLAVLTACVVACTSESDPNTPGNSAGSGGSSNTTSGASAGGTPSTSGASTGGAGQSGAGQSGAGQSGGGSTSGGSAGAGGGSSGTGGGGSGGGGTTAFKCPAGSEAMVPTIPATAGAAVANVPPAGFDPENLEGPVWINGYLYLSEIAKRSSQDAPQGGRIIRYQPGGTATPFLLDVGTNGLAVNSAGELVAASQKEGGIVAFDISGASPPATPQTVYAKEFADTDGMTKRFSSPNDVTLRSDGNIYFTDPAYQAGSVKQSAERTYRIAPGGMVTAIAGAPTPPNGIALSPDQNSLYVGGAKLMKYPVMADGSLGTGADFGSLFGTDGLGIDCAGNIYAAIYGEGKVVVLRPDGMKLGEITVGSGVTNVAFGGTDSKTLFITRMTPPSLYAVTMNIPGFPY